jgi:MFS-type transporter involved in bile tolerance (Atg22 family)
MGWDIGRRNNFQIEVGMANLSWGLVAIAAVAWDWGTTAYAAITLVFALYLAQAFALHVISILEGSETRSGRSAHVGAALTAAMAAVLAYYAISGLSDVDARPF